MFLTCKLFHLCTIKQVNRNCKSSKLIQFICRTICEYCQYVHLAISPWDYIIMHIVLTSPLLTVANNLLSNSCHLPLYIELDFLLSWGKKKNKPKTIYITLNQQKPTPKQKSFEDGIWEVLFVISHSTSSSFWLWQAQAVCSLPVSPALTPPGCLVPVNLYCQESLAWGSIGHLGINYERRSNALQMKAVSHSTQCIFQTAEEQPPGSRGGYRTDPLAYGNSGKGGRDMKERTSSCLDSHLKLVANRIKYYSWKGSITIF